MSNPHSLSRFFARVQHRMLLPMTLVCCTVAVDLSCNESLPPRVEPKSLFVGNVRIVYYNTTAKGNINQLWVYLDVKNVFDETLQDTVNLAGSLEIVLARDPVYRKTAILSPTNLVTGGIYDQRTGQLTVNSGDSLTILYKWDFLDDNGESVPENAFHLMKDIQCPFRTFAPPETFIIRGSLQVFDRIGQVSFFPFHYILNYYVGSC